MFCLSSPIILTIMIDSSTLSQVTALFEQLSTPLVFRTQIGSQRVEGEQMRQFLTDFASTSPLLSVEHEQTTSDDALSFSLYREGVFTGISYRGIPNGHEFTSLLMAVFNANGLGKNLPDEVLRQRILSLKGGAKITTYVSLTCTNCPDVVQALQVIALLHPNISHEMVDGGLFQEEVEQRGIQGVPAVFVEGEMIHSGKGSLSDLLDKLEKKLGTDPSTQTNKPSVSNVDLVVVGGGPAGISSAIYSARKGLRVALVAERLGGQVLDTVDIENVISVPHTTGAQLAADLRRHAESYSIEIFTDRRVSRMELTTPIKHIETQNGEVFEAPSVILAMGAEWRKLGVPGEEALIGRGVHFCPHCDGPFYKDKSVAVVGGGNSGVEAALDLANICQHVTLLEFADHLLADQVLQEKLRALPNADIHTLAQTTEILQADGKMAGLQWKNRSTDAVQSLAVDGVFVQIGLAPRTELVKGQLTLSQRGEIVVDERCRTSVPGVYAAGDVTTVPYKQIVVAMGEGAKAALSAFEDRLKSTVAS